MPAGRPSTYTEELGQKIIGLYEAGGTNTEVAQIIGVNQTTLWEWRKRYPELSNAVKAAKDLVDQRVIEALYESALAGDTTAKIFWLKNRQSKEWRDRQEHGGPDGGPIEFVVKSILEDK